MRPQQKLLLNSLIGLFGIVLALLLIELVFRLIPAAPKHAWSDRPKKYFRHEPAKTMQDFARSEAKPPNTFRVAVVGDSFTFAPYMQFTDAFPYKLQQILNMNDVPLKAEVINYGVPGYSASHEVAIVERAIREQADLILLQITLNDPKIKPYRPTGLEPNSRFGPYQGPSVARALLRHWKSLFFVLERLHNSKTHREYKEYHLGFFEKQKTWKPYTKVMAQMAKLAGAANIKIGAVIFPIFGIPLDADYPFTPAHKKLGVLLEQIKVPYLDLFSAYAGIPLERIQVIPGEDRHPNEIAHRIAAEQIYDWLASINYLPQDLLVRYWYQERNDIIKNKRISTPAT